MDAIIDSVWGTAHSQGSLREADVITCCSLVQESLAMIISGGCITQCQPRP